MPPEAEPFDPSASLQALAEGGVDFVVIGGVAGGGYGSSYGTFDLDIVGIQGAGVRLQHVERVCVDRR